MVYITHVSPPKNTWRNCARWTRPTSYKWSSGAPINGLINWVTGVLQGAPFHSIFFMDPLPSVWRSLPRRFLRWPNCHSFRTVLPWRALDSHVTGRWFWRQRCKKKHDRPIYFGIFWMENMKTTGTTEQLLSSWWFQPLWKIWVIESLLKMASSSPILGVKIKHVWNHHPPVIGCFMSTCLTL